MTADINTYPDSATAIDLGTADAAVSPRRTTRLIPRQLTAVRSRLAGLRGDGGYSTEAVVVIALLVAMAIAAVAIISAKVLAKAHGLSTG